MEKQKKRSIHKTWRSNVRRLRHHETLASISPVPSLKPFKLDQSSVYQPISKETLHCINLPVPYLYGFPLKKIQDDYEHLRSHIVGFAKNYLGLPYRFGGMSPETGFDCSGFTQYIMHNFGVSISRTSRDQANMGQKIEVDEARKGDLLFFGRKRKDGTWYVNHVAMVVSEEGEDLTMIHSCNRGIVVDNVYSASWRSYYKRRFMGVRRILKKSDYDQVVTMNPKYNAYNTKS